MRNIFPPLLLGNEILCNTLNELSEKCKNWKVAVMLEHKAAAGQKDYKVIEQKHKDLKVMQERLAKFDMTKRKLYRRRSN